VSGTCSRLRRRLARHSRLIDGGFVLGLGERLDRVEGGLDLALGNHHLQRVGLVLRLERPSMPAAFKSS
jgi:hypothetical protein